MNLLKKLLLSACTVFVMASPAMADQPESPVCNSRNCDQTHIVNEQIETSFGALEMSTSEEVPKPLCEYPNCRPNPTTR